MANASRSYCSPASQLAVANSRPQDAMNRKSSPSMMLFPPVGGSLQIHQRISVSSSKNKDCDSNTLNFDCQVPDNALSYIDDFLNGDFAAHEELVSDISADPFTALSFPYNIDLLTSASLHSFGLDQLNLLLEESGPSLHSTEAPEHRKSMPGLEPDFSVSNAELLPLNIVRNDELVPYLVNATVVDCHASREPINLFSGLLHQKPRQCEHCEVLRQIIHTNGIQGTKLEIHGCEGQNYHAVMQTRFWLNDGCPPTVEQQMVEFPVGNSDYVKQFLLQYSLLRKKEGFVLQQDSLLPTSNTGLETIPADRIVAALSTSEARQCLHLNFSADPSPIGYMEEKSELLQHRIVDPDDAVKNETFALIAKPIRSSAAAQREKTGKLQMSDLAKHFHLPINAAAKELGICPTVLKKICRRNGMRRWPHRKIKSIERIIATLEQTIADGAGQGDEGIRKEIALLRNERSQLCAGLMSQTDQEYL